MGSLGRCAGRTHFPRGELPPMEADVRNEDGEESDEDDLHGEAGLAVAIPCGDGLQHPRPDKGEGERVGANHPLAMLRDVAVARREECGCGGNHPSASLAAGGDHKVDGAGIVTVIREDDGERRGDEDCNHVGSAKNAMQAWEAAADAAGKLQRAAEQCQEPSGNVRPDDQGDGAEVCTLLRLPQQRHFTVQGDGDRRGRDDNPERQLARMDSPWRWERL